VRHATKTAIIKAQSLLSSTSRHSIHIRCVNTLSRSLADGQAGADKRG
jgi:hypothetical protein